jgi:sugar phosphate isomerase/epimerase
MTRPDSRGLHLNGATIMTTPTDRHVQVARAAGYAGVEVRAERLLGAPDELRRAASTVRPGEVWSLNGIQVKVDTSGVLRRDLLADELPPRLAVCRAVGAAYLLVVPPRIAGVDHRSALAVVREGLAIVRDRAAADGIRVAFEFLGFADCPIDSPALALEVVDGVPGADLVVDSCHWHASGSQPLDGFPIDRVAMVHLNDAPEKEPRAIEDADRLLPGLGVIRLAELIGSLRKAGYDGPWSVETFNPAYWERDPETVAREALHRTRTFLGDAVAGSPGGSSS